MVGGERQDRIFKVTEDYLHDASDTMQGRSGSPVLGPDDDGVLWVAGVHAHSKFAHSPDLGLEANGAPRITPLVLERIQRWLQISEPSP